MSSQRYTRLAADDSNGHDLSHTPVAIPDSPPPSFRSRASLRGRSGDDYHRNDEERHLDDAFDAPSDDEDDNLDEDTRDRRWLFTNNGVAAAEVGAVAQTSHTARSDVSQTLAATTSGHTLQPSSGRMAGNSQVNDGVFANLNAKPRVGEDAEEKPPTYEQAAADATPPYWETTILSPYATSGNPDDVFVDGLLVGSLFSFIWNALISMSFQLIGFLLTYLLHTTHAAKHGSRAGLGITLVQYGFQMRYSSTIDHPSPDSSAPVETVPEDPNSHDFDSNKIPGTASGSKLPGLSTSDWLSYIFMIVGWFILIRAVSDFIRARRQEALVRSSPDRGLGVAVVAENEDPETSV